MKSSQEITEQYRKENNSDNMFRGFGITEHIYNCCEDAAFYQLTKVSLRPKHLEI